MINGYETSKDIKGGQRIMWKFQPVEKASEGIQVETAWEFPVLLLESLLRPTSSAMFLVPVIMHEKHTYK